MLAASTAAAAAVVAAAAGADALGLAAALAAAAVADPPVPDPPPSSLPPPLAKARLIGEWFWRGLDRPKTRSVTSETARNRKSGRFMRLPLQALRGGRSWGLR